MKNLIVILLASFVLVGCSTSSLKLNKDEKLTLNFDSQNILLANKVIDSKLLNFKDLFVTISKLENESGRVLFYEDARTTLNFEFMYDGLYSVMYIFDDVKHYYDVYQRNNLRLVQLELKDSQYINVMIQASDSQEYSYIYGFSNEEFIKIAKKLKLSEDKKIAKVEYSGTIFDRDSKPLSNWNASMVYFSPLITPLRALGGR